MAADLPDFDPRVIERFAESAYRRASAIFVGCISAGVVMGGVFGATPLTPLGAGWPIPAAFGFATTLAGALIGGMIGYVVGDTRSALCRLQGQTALAQIEGAKHASAMAEAMREIHEIHEQIRGLRVPAPAPAPAPPPAAVPEPVPEPVVAPAPPREPPLTALPPLRVASGGTAQVQPPPLSPPSA